MLQLFGFGAEMAKEFYFGVSETGDAREKREEVIAFTVSNHWVSALMERGEAPQESLGDEFEVDDLNLDIFFPRIKAVLEKGSKYKWLEASAEDLGDSIRLRDAGGPVAVVKAEPRQEEVGSKPDSQPETPVTEPGEATEEEPDISEVFDQEELDDLYSSVQELLDQG
jgi:hypothetical protein